MSFKNLKHKDLLYAAEFFDVQGVTEESTRAEIIAGLEENNISWANYKKFVEVNGQEVVGENGDVINEEKSQAAPIVFSDDVLLKMDRQNPTFEILGYRFTKKQPFLVLTADEAQKVIDAAESLGGGFRIASPAEARSYFG